ncbi:MAG: hypothetical protein AB1757_15125 [Acidobacteriota bacterium]
MGFLGFVVKTIGSIVAFVIAVKLIAFVLMLLGIALKLIWLVFWVALFGFVAFALYKIFAPNHARTI